MPTANPRSDSERPGDVFAALRATVSGRGHWIVVTADRLIGLALCGLVAGLDRPAGAGRAAAYEFDFLVAPAGATVPLTVAAFEKTLVAIGAVAELLALFADDAPRIRAGLLGGADVFPVGPDAVLAAVALDQIARGECSLPDPSAN